MKTRIILLGISTLIIGFILGMLTSAQLRLHRLKPLRFYYSEERFREGFYKTVQPDENQKAKIDLILDKYSKLNSDLQSTFRKETEANMSSMRKELESNLTKEQLARMKEMEDRMREMMKEARRKRMNDTTRFRYDHRRFPGRPSGIGMEPFGPPPFHDFADSTKSSDRK